MRTPEKIPLSGLEPGYEINGALAEELARLAGMLRQRFGTSADDNTESMLIARLVQGLGQDAWSSLVKVHKLDAWLGIPLGADVTESVLTLSDTLDRLIFQRDHDALTGLANRRFFDHYLMEELERAERTGAPLSLLLLDLDDFKGINDSMGHACGDMVLKELGALLNKSQRSYDLAARVGGEEFTVILPGVSVWRAKNTAERLLKSFREIQFQCEGQGAFSVTFSCGLAWVSPESGYLSAEDLFKLADQAMYSAKKQGRNRVCLSAGLIYDPAGAMVLAQEKQFLFTAPE